MPVFNLAKLSWADDGPDSGYWAKMKEIICPIWVNETDWNDWNEATNQSGAT